MIKNKSFFDKSFVKKAKYKSFDIGSVKNKKAKPKNIMILTIILWHFSIWKKEILEENHFMIKIQNMQKRIFALFVAALLLICTAPEVFATEVSEGPEGVALSEAPEENSDIGEKLEVPVDYSELEMQIALANGLNKREYTKSSWEALEKSVADGLKIIGEKASQAAVNEAISVIEDAIAGLEKMDYSGLEKALGEVYDIIDKNSLQHDLWSRMDTAVEEARAILISGNQETVDKAAAELNALAKEFIESGSIVQEPEVVITTVEVEVPPSEDFCNIPAHRVWPILFVLSLVLNIATIGTIAYLFIRKRNTEDNIPLVNYDIDDDFDDLDDIDDFDDTDDIGNDDFDTDEDDNV